VLSAILLSGDDSHAYRRFEAALGKRVASRRRRFFRTLSKRERRRGRDERGNDGWFQFPPPACVAPQAELSLARGNAINEAHRFPTRAPRHFPPSVEGRSPGLWIDAYRLPGSSRSQWQSSSRTRNAKLGCWVIRPRHLPLRGQQRPWKDSHPGFRQGEPLSDPSILKSASAPLFPFHPGASTRRDTSKRAR